MRRVIALGNFDGVHLGHRVVLERAVSAGTEHGMTVVAATFDPHPRAVLRPESAPKLLSALDVRQELLLDAGVHEVAIIPFDRDLSNKSPESFVRDILVGELDAAIVVVGENFRFGYRASGDFGDLKRLMSESGGDAVSVGVRLGGDGSISSTAIRAAISGGCVEEAAGMLGRYYAVRGCVVHGDQRGRTIGFPTANLHFDETVAVPANGVYACYVKLGDEHFEASVNIGVAPTFGERDRKLEVHILDFDRDIYGEEVDVEFVARIRGEKKFSGVEELVQRISQDIEEAREKLGR